MLFQIPNILSADELQQIRESLAKAEFVDGKATAGWYAKQVKHTISSSSVALAKS